MSMPLEPAELAFVVAIRRSECARDRRYGWSERQRLARRVSETRQALIEQGYHDDDLRHFEQVAMPPPPWWAR